MKVVTFYSFNGGVGRTLALVNTAVQLAKCDKRVLLVDFDLGVPGLDTFTLLKSKSPKAGVVEFISSYWKDNRAPDVSEYVAQTDAYANLFVMSAGSWSSSYAASFAKIDWQVLYTERDGYLLMEDLKQQWQQTIQPDYVFIDAPSGYSDIGAVCTRQLPDGVIVFYLPNQQNLRGLINVVRDIRAEASTPREKIIKLHFVLSSVPDLDDEDDVLQKTRARFHEQLKMEVEPSIIYRYDSLSLLNHEIFVEERPKSRLAAEYAALADRIIAVI